MCAVYSQQTAQLWLVSVLTIAIWFASHKTLHWKVALVRATLRPSTPEETQGRILRMVLPTWPWLWKVQGNKYGAVILSVTLCHFL
jgi:hypothetical protein